MTPESPASRGRGAPAPAPAPAPDAMRELLRRKISGGRSGWIRWFVLLGITIAVFAFLSTRLDFSGVRAVLQRADGFTIVLAFLVTATFPLLSALRWRRMLRALGHEVSLRDCFDMIMAAWPVGTVTPSKAGDLVKAYYLKDRIPVSIVVGSVIAERVLDVLVLLLLALGGCLAFQRWELAALAGGGLVCGIAALLVVAHVPLPLPPKWKDKLEGLLRMLRLVLSSPALFGSVLLFTVLNWMASVVQVVLCYRALGTEVPVLFTTGALPLAIFIGLLPLTLSGMGTRDSALIALFTRYAAPEVSLGVGLLYTLFGYWIPAVVGLPFLRRALPR